MAELGDIVIVGSGLKYSVLEWIDSHPKGGRNARLIRKNSDGSTSAFVKDAEYLHVVETPVFEEGEEVSRGLRKGTYLGTEDDVCLVQMPERRRELQGGGFNIIDAHIERVPKAILVIENRRL